ncbi:hypothetical protein C4572_01595 [Candidatus Parcubacteria bacterium]|nr:MAG: hypothetical protein C4572_01595 [Candidatus Parcubacteria bacterium]
MQNSLKFKWSAPEYEHHEKTPEWYWALGIIIVALTFAAVILGNFLFAVLVVLSGFLLAIFGARKPNLVDIELNPGGITIGNRELTYENLNAFWVEYGPGRKELLLDSKKTFATHIVIQLGHADPEEVRAYLLKYIKEKKIHEPLFASIARFLKF